MKNPNCAFDAEASVQAVGGIIRDTSFSVAHWLFAFNYFQSSLVMPAWFGGPPISEKRKTCMKRLNAAMISLNIFVPTLAWSVLLTAQLMKNFNERLLDYYGFLVLGFEAVLLIEALLLFYAVMKIRIILRKNGLSHRVNVSMISLNATLFLLQVVGGITWYFNFW